MKYLLILLMFTSCKCSVKYAESKPKLQQETEDLGISGCEIIIIDSCQYIKMHTYGNDIITHRGRCIFCQQRNKCK